MSESALDREERTRLNLRNILLGALFLLVDALIIAALVQGFLLP